MQIFLRERQKLRETFGEVICVSQYACSLKIKKQKKMKALVI